jgi:hypothetical protein
VLDIATLPRITDRPDRELSFLSIHSDQARTVLLQCVQAGFPRAQHRNGIPCTREPRSNERRKRARADDLNVLHFDNKSDSHLFKVAVISLLSEFF